MIMLAMRARCRRMAVRRPRSSAALLTAVLALATGCGALPEKPRVVELPTDVVVAEDLNPDPSGRASPLVLAIYQLRSADMFLSKDFFAVFDPEGTALGDDLIKRDQLMLQPGADQSFEAEIDRETAFIGLVGAFSDLDQAEWRAVVEIPERSLLKRVNPFSDDRLHITIGARSVAAAIGEG